MASASALSEGAPSLPSGHRYLSQPIVPCSAWTSTVHPCGTHVARRQNEPGRPVLAREESGCCVAIATHAKLRSSEGTRRCRMHRAKCAQVASSLSSAYSRPGQVAMNSHHARFGRRTAADLELNRDDCRPLRVVLTPVLWYHPDFSLRDVWGALLGLAMTVASQEMQPPAILGRSTGAYLRFPPPVSFRSTPRYRA